MRFDLISIFPNFFASIFEYGILNRARTTGLVEIATHDLRAFTHDRHRTVDDRPFGGGEGMVLKLEPIYDAVSSLNITHKRERDPLRESVVVLSAQGRPFTQKIAHELAGLERVVLICGRYEGVDERVNDLLCDRELSIGDYVLSGGELAAAVIVDAVVRLLPGALGHPDSSRFESFGMQDAGEEPEAPGSPPRTIRITRGRPSLTVVLCPRCCREEIMMPSAYGAERWLSKRHLKTDRICWKGRNLRRWTDECCKSFGITLKNRPMSDLDRLDSAFRACFYWH